MVRAPTLVATPPISTATTSITLRGVHQRKKSHKLLLATAAAAASATTNTNTISFISTCNSSMTDDDMYDDDFEGDDDGNGNNLGGGKGRNKSRRELPNGAVETLKAWLLAPEHFTHPYPTPQDQAMLMQKTGIDKKQLKNWFTNARRRIWKPMLKKQIESGTIVTNVNVTYNSNGNGITTSVPGGTTNPTASMENPHSVQAVRVHYQQAMQDQNIQQQQQQQQMMVNTSYANPLYSSNLADGTTSGGGQQQFYGGSDPIQSNGLSSSTAHGQIPSNGQLNKADSHAVLMELFARDQDLVRQATESARLKAESKQQQQQQQHQHQNHQDGQMNNNQASMMTSNGQEQQQQQQQMVAAPTSQHPMMKAPSGVLAVPSLNSWPHFSSITSLNNLGTIPGVKSITSLSGIDLASKGNVNKMGNIAQVKSMESMGKNDSYAFLELFFGDRSSTNLSYLAGSGPSMTGMSSKGNLMGLKQGGEEDNEIGLSLEDESPSHTTRKEFLSQSSMNQGGTTSSFGSSLSNNIGQQSQQDTGYLKRAYDDALAARGLISVSRSCEKLTDLELPAKIQRTLSQEFLNIEQEQQMRQQVQQQKDQIYIQQQQQSAMSSSSSSQQYPGQQASEPQGNVNGEGTSSTDNGVTNIKAQQGHVQVASTTTCALCGQTNIDTQLRPCGHMFHESCLKPALSSSSSSSDEQPKCPMDDIPINSAVLAIPETSFGQQQLQQVDPLYSKSSS